MITRRKLTNSLVAVNQSIDRLDSSSLIFSPPGTVLPLDRRRELLELCREHDLLVLEEDPHHLLQYGDQTTTPSLLSLDTEGRVLRWVNVPETLN